MFGVGFEIVAWVGSCGDAGMVHAEARRRKGGAETLLLRGKFHSEIQTFEIERGFAPKPYISAPLLSSLRLCVN
jgi:hypothetical protein